MNDLDYDSFFYLGDRQTHYLSEALAEDGKHLDHNYDRSLFRCPECHEAVLDFTSGSSVRRAYLSSRDISQHSIDCSHRYKQISRASCNTYYKHLSDSQITDKLDAAMNHFFVPERNEISRTKNSGYLNPLVVHLPDNRNRQVKRALPSRSLLTDVFSSDAILYGVPILFY